MIPKRKIAGVIEITTGSMIFTERPPAFTGESQAIQIEISLLSDGDAYSASGQVAAEMYLYWPGTIYMSETVELALDGSVLKGSIPAELMGKAGNPLLVIQMLDVDTSELIVAAATPIQITEVRGTMVLSSRAPTPSEIVYVGRSPYIDPVTTNWIQWDAALSEYVDTGVKAAGAPASFTALVETLAAGSNATASITGTPAAPILNLGIPRGDKGETGNAAGFGTPTASVTSTTGTPSVTVTASGPDTAKIFDFAFSNLKGDKGDTGDPTTATAQDIVISDEDDTTVGDALSSLSDKIANLQIADYDATDGSIVFRNSDVASYDATDGSVVINI